MKLGVNSVLFSKFDFAVACEHIKKAGYDGVEIAAIKGMCEHLNLDDWQSQVTELRRIVADNDLQLLSMEEAALDEDRLIKAFAAAAELGIPVVNVGSGGASDSEEDFQRQTALLGKMAEKAENFGVTLCVKAHVGAAIFDTPTTLRAMERIPSLGFGIDMDPSHIFRAQEEPEKALKQVIGRVRHIHIRDCQGRNTGPGEPETQACGRGDINLLEYCRVLTEANYTGPVCLEVIGARERTLAEVSIIAAESYGYLNACLKSLGAR